MPENTHSHASEKRLADMVRQLVFGLGHGLISILSLSHSGVQWTEVIVSNVTPAQVSGQGYLRARETRAAFP